VRLSPVSAMSVDAPSEVACGAKPDMTILPLGMMVPPGIPMLPVGIPPLDPSPVLFATSPPNPARLLAVKCE
jgi:hypothetical protein